mmetsp:Transcript_86320/g.185015  ORF Transcript_86320/g.185015 Transcript_86320/m.185015 type:complete len:298 (-) Transcript_86320:1755-2648(-)
MLIPEVAVIGSIRHIAQSLWLRCWRRVHLRGWLRQGFRMPGPCTTVAPELAAPGPMFWFPMLLAAGEPDRAVVVILVGRRGAAAFFGLAAPPFLLLRPSNFPLRKAHDAIEVEGCCRSWSRCCGRRSKCYLRRWSSRRGATAAIVPTAPSSLAKSPRGPPIAEGRLAIKLPFPRCPAWQGQARRRLRCRTLPREDLVGVVVHATSERDGILVRRRVILDIHAQLRVAGPVDFHVVAREIKLLSVPVAHTRLELDGHAVRPQVVVDTQTEIGVSSPMDPSITFFSKNLLSIVVDPFAS